MKFKDKDILLAEYKAAAEEASAYWKKKPTDPNAGKNIIQQTQKNDNAATLVPPDRKRSKGKGRSM